MEYFKEFDFIEGFEDLGYYVKSNKSLTLFYYS